MMKKKYIVPQACTIDMQPIQLFAYSVQSGTADPDSPILVKRNEWDIFGESEDDEPKGFD